MNQSCLFIVTLLVCCAHLSTSAPNPTIGLGGVGVGFGYGVGYGGGIGGFGYSPIVGDYGYYPRYGYSGYGLYGHPYGRRYRYPHFYPPIAVLAG